MNSQIRKVPKDVRLLCLGIASLFFTVGSAQQYIVPWFDAQNHPGTANSLLACLYLSFVACSFFAHRLIARIGEIRSLYLAKSLYTLFLFVVALGSPDVGIISAAICGFAASILWTTERVLLNTLPSPENREASAGAFYFSYYLGTSLGCLLMGILVARWSFPIPMLGCALLSVLAMVPLLFLGPIRSESLAQGAHVERWPAFGPTVFRVVASVFSFRLVYGLAISRIPHEISGRWGAGSVGPASALFFIASALVALFGGKLVGRWGIWRTAVVAFAASLAGMALLFVGSTGSLLLIGFFVAGIGVALMNPVESLMAGNISPPGQRLRVSSTFTLASCLGTSSVLVADRWLAAETLYLLVGGAVAGAACLMLPLVAQPAAELQQRVHREIKKRRPTVFA